MNGPFELHFPGAADGVLALPRAEDRRVALAAGEPAGRD